MATELTKIKVLVILGVLVVLFGVLGWSWVRPADGYDGMTVVLSGKPMRVILSGLGLGLIGVLLGVLFGRRHGMQMGMLAIPTGLTVWAILSGNMDWILLEYSSVEARQGLFTKLMGDAVIWSGLVGVGCGLTWLMGGLIKSFSAENLEGVLPGGENQPEEKSEPSGVESKEPEKTLGWDILGIVVSCVMVIILAKILFMFESYVITVIAIAAPVIVYRLRVMIIRGELFTGGKQSNPKVKAVAAKFNQGDLTGYKLFINRWLQVVCGFVICSITALLLIKVLGQARNVLINPNTMLEASMVPAGGQIIFAVGLGFYLAAIAAHQCTKIPLWNLLVCPLLISLIAYYCGFQNGIIETLNGSGPAFVPKSIVFATILPIQFIGVGTFALMGGYYYSEGMRKD
ncbi:MAG: hypothetical protein GY869_20715 [Planctomycetes bacterium]|nr:hypothetical protein [Planctomycetota bacterium]